MTATAVAANAQVGFGWGPKIGFNASKITKSGADSKLGMTGGLFFGYNFTRSFGVEVGALYSQQGASKGNMKLTAGYMNFPVVAKIPIFVGLHGFVGPQFAANVSGKLKYGDTKVKMKGLFNKWDVGGIAGLGYQFNFGLNIGLNYNFGFVDMVNKDFVYKSPDNIVNVNDVNALIDDIDGKNGTWQLTFGWRF